MELRGRNANHGASLSTVSEIWNCQTLLLAEERLSCRRDKLLIRSVSLRRRLAQRELSVNPLCSSVTIFNPDGSAHGLLILSTGQRSASSA